MRLQAAECIVQSQTRILAAFRNQPPGAARVPWDDARFWAGRTVLEERNRGVVLLHGDRSRM